MKQKLLCFLAALLCITQFAFAQSTITGKVVDSKDNSPLPGANIRVKGTNQGVATSNNGTFSLSITGLPKVLVVSMLGYTDKEVPVNANSNNITISLSESDNTLDEVVVSGLATTVKRKNLANAVSSVSAAELTGVTKPQTTDGALYGKVVGANIRSNGGAPGGGMSITLRGMSSLVGNSQPLIILDGVYINNSTQSTGRATVSGAGNSQQDDGANRLADINPDEIENMEILKGPSAAAIYGTRANAGVIIITTKKGKAGRTTVSIAEDLGLITPLKLLGVDEWNEDKINYFWRNDATKRATELNRFRTAQTNGTNINYEDYFYNHQRMSTNTRLNISGGNDNTKFFVSGGFNDEKGLVKNTGFQRYSIRGNIDQRITKDIQLTVNQGFTRSNTDRGFTGNQNRTGASIGYGISAVPTYFDLRPNANGIYPDNPYFSENPINVTDNGVNNSLVNRSITSFNLNVNLMQRDNSYLKFIFNGGLDYLQNTTTVLLPETLQFQKSQANPGDLLTGKQESFNTNLQAALVYNYNVGKVNMTTQTGLVRLNFRDNSLFARGQGLAPLQENIKFAALQTVLNQNFGRTQDAGAFVQQEANWDDKVIATLGIRFDRSSLNGNSNKTYAFPKASVAVNLTNFDFFKSTPFSQFKPRVAYGETAGPVAFGNRFISFAPINHGGSLGMVVPSSFGNSIIRPETAKELELGLDFGLFKNRLQFEGSYYIKTTANNIQSLNLSPASGVTSQISNYAELENKGIELSLAGRIIESPKFKWNSRVMWWRNSIYVTKLDIPTYVTGGFGPAYGTFLIKEGVKLGTIVGNPNNTVYGNSQPDFNMSWNNSFTIANTIDISFLWDWKKGGYNSNLTSLTTDQGATTAGWWADQRYTLPNIPSRYIQEASYIKLREVGVYYTMPTAVTQKLFNSKVQKFRAGISGNNLIMISKYMGYDPESSTFGAGLANNVDVTPYPSAKRFFLNLSLDF